MGRICGIRARTKHSLCWPWPHHPTAQFKCYGRISSESYSIACVDVTINQVSLKWHPFLVPGSMQTFTAPKTVSLASYDVIPLSSGTFDVSVKFYLDDSELAFPHLKAGCASLYSTHKTCPGDDLRSLVLTTNSWIRWPRGQYRDNVVLYMSP